mmetsp:Transcript_4658/g.16689  ORF Transcript_4658/g.16689 Transcript_4658/m.16689 type:complete len:520 (+) Transcript_4658:110-1669(+)
MTPAMAALECGKGVRVPPVHAALSTRPRRPRSACRAAVTAVAAPTPTGDDWSTSLASRLNELRGPDSVTDGSGLAGFREVAVEKLQTQRLPTTRDEPFRFTDVAFLKETQLVAPPAEPGAVDTEPVAIDGALEILFVDGKIVASSAAAAGTAGLSVQMLSEMGDSDTATSVIEMMKEAAIQAEQDAASNTTGPRGKRVVGSAEEVFASLNAAALRDVVVLMVDEGAQIEQPVHLVYATSASNDEGALSLSAPRCVVTVGEGGQMTLVESFVSLDKEWKGTNGGYLCTSVGLVSLADNAKLDHAIIQTHNKGATDKKAAAGKTVHLRRTQVNQARASSYKVTEADIGASLSRHDLRIKQLGPETSTQINTFTISGDSQLHDLHSCLVLDHPDGFCEQKHKCIVSSASGRGVFDGNIQVNKAAQQTDAGQLTRTLLLEPQATINVRPNLQIIADNVKCAHGATVCDLDEEEVFYLMSRGIKREDARKTLIVSFAADIIKELPAEDVRERVSSIVRSELADA